MAGTELDALFTLQAAREAAMMKRTAKAFLIMGVGCAITMAAFAMHYEVIAGFGTIWMFLSLAFALALVLGTILRRVFAWRFRALLRDRRDHIVELHAHRDALVIQTMDGGRGTAVFFDTDVARATELLREICPNVRN